MAEDEKDGMPMGGLRGDSGKKISQDDKRTSVGRNASLVDKEMPSVAAPDARLVTSRYELWAYYLYYIGNNGLSGFNFGPSQFQNLLFLAATCDDNGLCLVPFAGERKTEFSHVVRFGCKWNIFRDIDYGTWRPNILIAFTVFGIAISFGWLGVEDASKWPIGTGLYIVGLIAYQGSLTFWTAAFPGLVRNLPEVQDSAAALVSGEKSFEDHMSFDSLQRNRVSNMAFAIQSVAEIFVLAIMVGILKGLHSESSVENNTRAFSVLIAFSGAVWLVCAVPWFVIEKRRPGLEPPPGTNLLTIGFKQTYRAFRECMKLKQTFLYLLVYFLLGDVLNTTVTVVATLQNQVVSYSTLELTYLLLVGITTQFLGIYGFWLVQKRYRISTKTMLLFVALWILVLTLWGFVGIWTPKFGFKNVWEVWVYQAYYGLMVCPWYAYSQTMISEVVPRGEEFLFFALFSIVGKSTSFIGPFVCSAITDDTMSTIGKLNTPFSFLLALGIVSTFLLFFVDVEKSRLECAEFVKVGGEEGSVA